MSWDVLSYGGIHVGDHALFQGTLVQVTELTIELNGVIAGIETPNGGVLHVSAHHLARLVCKRCGFRSLPTPSHEYCGAACSARRHDAYPQPNEVGR